MKTFQNLDSTKYYDGSAEKEQLQEFRRQQRIDRAWSFASFVTLGAIAGVMLMQFFELNLVEVFLQDTNVPS